MTAPLDAAEGVVAELAAFGFGKVGEKGANAGVERHYAITAWGLNVALRRVRDDEPVEAAFLHQPAFFVLRRNGLSHPQRSQNGVIDAVLRHGVVWYVAGLPGVLAAAVAELCEWFVGSVALFLVGLEFQVEGLDVAHGPAGVPDCGALHLVRYRLPFRLQHLQLRHHHASDVPPRGRYARLQDFNRQVVGPSAGVQPGCYPGLLLLVRIGPYPARLPLGSGGVRASGS